MMRARCPRKRWWPKRSLAKSLRVRPCALVKMRMHLPLRSPWHSREQVPLRPPGRSQAPGLQHQPMHSPVHVPQCWKMYSLAPVHRCPQMHSLAPVLRCQKMHSQAYVPHYRPTRPSVHFPLYPAMDALALVLQHPQSQSQSHSRRGVPKQPLMQAQVHVPIHASRQLRRRPPNPLPVHPLTYHAVPPPSPRRQPYLPPHPHPAGSCAHAAAP